MSLLLLDKNTQVVNTHEQVGGLIDISRKYTFKRVGTSQGELDLGFKTGVFFGNYPSQVYNIVCAILRYDNNGDILVSHSTFNFFNESSPGLVVYKKESGGNWFLKNNNSVKGDVNYSVIILQ